MKTIKEIQLGDRGNAILRRINDTVRALLPDSEVILFGSRARGEPREYSDWDILILTETVTPEIKHRIYEALYDIELDHEIIIGPLIIPREEWTHKRFRTHPIHECIDDEGVLV